jgi:hypothetical protein
MAFAAFERFQSSFFEDLDSPRNGLERGILAAVAGRPIPAQ